MIDKVLISIKIIVNVLKKIGLNEAINTNKYYVIILSIGMNYNSNFPLSIFSKERIKCQG